MQTLPRLEDEMHRLVSEAQKEGLLLRLIGGLAVKVHSPHATHRALVRDYPDIDFVTDKAGALKLEEFLTQRGYTPNKAFNTFSGDRRQLYYDQERSRQIDVFIGDFAMCHKLPLADRLHVEPLTIPLAELFLTKAQIVQLNRKDVLDLLALLLDHQVGSGDEETINQDLVAHLCAQDWGLYTTVSMTIERLHSFMERGEAELLSEQQVEMLKGRLKALQEAMDRVPKSLAWKMRAKIGKRRPWYDEVEEVRR
jgi:hypothetical protein